ncbi:LysR family transcriptional regulator substrate-binding protein [uncultured Arthrobacter sp.]|uniref:LysR family transcriptional regulator substrate-binding protein n=1 Tax=uncultured Arthrobacter sp. TaxID=114050 RepID=UPI00262CA900|nr:LysR family transcriptional regulator substrate-binding protein [uncultured Arthrobacter sp.]
MPADQPRVLSVGFVPGVTPGKWASRWRERHPSVPLELHEHDADAALEGLRNGSDDVVFVRLPVERAGLHLIPLYEEQPVVVMSRENELSLLDEVPPEELGAQTLLDVGACGGPGNAVEVAASGAGVVVLPMSLARLHARKDAVHRPVPGLPVTTIGIAWRVEDESDDVEEFIGIVRGRTAQSSRQPSRQEAPKRTAAQKAAAKKAATGRGGGQQGSGQQGSGRKGSGQQSHKQQGSGQKGGRRRGR